jgi:hypothetical protein
VNSKRWICSLCGDADCGSPCLLPPSRRTRPRPVRPRPARSAARPESASQGSCCPRSTRPRPFSRPSVCRPRAALRPCSTRRARRQQVAPTTIAEFTEQWIRLILSYARFRGLFVLGVEDAEAPGNQWDEVLRNERIHSTCSLTRAFGGAHVMSRSLAAGVPERAARDDGRRGPGRVRAAAADAERVRVLAAARGVGRGPTRMGASPPLL